MLNLLALIIPLGLAGAISPVLLTEQTVLIAGPGGRRAGLAFAVAAIVTLMVFTGVLILFGKSISLPKEPHLSSGADVVLGALLLALAAFLFTRRPKESAPKPPRSDKSGGGLRGVLAFGTISMSTNFTTLALAIPAAKEIAASRADPPEQAFAWLVFVALAAIPAWAPLALTRLAPETADRLLSKLGDFIQRNGRRASVVLLTGFGAYLTIRGISKLV